MSAINQIIALNKVSTFNELFEFLDSDAVNIKDLNDFYHWGIENDNYDARKYAVLAKKSDNALATLALNDHNAYVRQAAVESGKLTKEQLDDIMAGEDTHTKTAILRQTNVSDEYIQLARVDTDIRARILGYQHKNTTAEELIEFYKANSDDKAEDGLLGQVYAVDARRKMIFHKNAPLELLQLAADEEDFSICYHLAIHPMIKGKTLEKLLSKSLSSVRAAAMQNINISDEQITAAIERAMSDVNDSNDGYGPTDVVVHKALLKNKDLPVKHLVHIYKSKHAIIRRMVLKHKNCPTSLIEQAMNDKVTSIATEAFKLLRSKKNK